MNVLGLIDEDNFYHAKTPKWSGTTAPPSVDIDLACRIAEVLEKHGQQKITIDTVMLPTIKSHVDYLTNPCEVIRDYGAFRRLNGTIRKEHSTLLLQMTAQAIEISTSQTVESEHHNNLIQP